MESGRVLEIRAVGFAARLKVLQNNNLHACLAGSMTVQRRDSFPYSEWIKTQRRTEGYFTAEVLRMMVSVRKWARVLTWPCKLCMDARRTL